jgi:hypothetical protein
VRVGEQTLALLDASGILSKPNNRASRAIGRTFFMSQQLNQEISTEQLAGEELADDAEAVTAEPATIPDQDEPDQQTEG